jgi:hypothetical protein
LEADINDFQPSTGKFGLHTNRALSRFAYLKIEEYIPNG